MYTFHQMFTDELNHIRIGDGYIAILKTVEGTYTFLQCQDYNDAMSLCDVIVRHKEGFTEASGWTVNFDGSLDDKLFTFFRKINSVPLPISQDNKDRTDS